MSSPSLPVSGLNGAGGAVGGAATGLPHEIRGALAIPLSWWQKGLVGLGLILLCLLIAWAWRFWRTRQRPQAVLNPWDRLRQRTAALRPMQPFTPPAQADFFFQLSLILREGIELRTGVQATDRTYQELRALLQGSLPLPAPQAAAALAFLERADLVKFANAPSDEPEALQAAQQVDEWLAGLRPAAAKQEAKEGPNALR